MLHINVSHYMHCNFCRVRLLVFCLQWIEKVFIEMPGNVDIALSGRRLCRTTGAILPRNPTNAIFILFVIALAVVTPCVADCPDQWDSYKDFCFRLTEDNSPSFNLAESLCRKLHPSAHLASLHSEEENAAALLAAKNKTAWIGLKRINDRWRWSDHTFVDFLNFDPPQLDPNTTCVQITEDKKWRPTAPCGDSERRKLKKDDAAERRKKRMALDALRLLPRISRKVSKTRKEARSPKGNKDEENDTGASKGKGNGLPALCKAPHMETCGGTDWIRAGEFCYNFSMPAVVKSWDEAGSYCLQMDARFVAVFNPRQNDVLRRLARLTGNNVWLGLIHTGDGFHRWADGALMTFDNFGPSDHYDADHACVLLDFPTGTWLHESCATPLHFVCMRPKLQLYDPRTANASQPRATVEIWRRIEEALVPARAPPPEVATPPPPQQGPGMRSSIREEAQSGQEDVVVGVNTASGGRLPPPRLARRAGRRPNGLSRAASEPD